MCVLFCFLLMRCAHSALPLPPLSLSFSLSHRILYSCMGRIIGVLNANERETENHFAANQFNADGIINKKPTKPNQEVEEKNYCYQKSNVLYYYCYSKHDGERYRKYFHFAVDWCGCSYY